jgi:ABC-type uncharacterized transport system involved in gliding motility auxiliary subunit
MRPIPRRLYAVAVVVSAVLIFAGFNIALDAGVANARLDLTENGRFTLSHGTRNVIGNLKEPVRLRFFYSKKVAADYAQTRAYADRVRDLLQRYASLSGGKIVLEEVNPEPFSPEEDQASVFGLTPAPTDSGETVYFGLVGTNRIDGRETIAYFSPERETYLEYDITSLIYRLASPEKPKLAILSSLPLDTGMGGMAAMVQGRSRPFAIYTEIARNYDIAMLPPDFAAIPGDVGVLLIVQPGKLADKQLYAIDQFVMKGGHVAAFVDPDSEIVSGGSPANGAAASDLPRLFRAWGVAFASGREIADLKLAQKVQTSTDPRSSVTLYPIWLHLTADSFDRNDPVTASMQSLNLAGAGALYPLKDATTKFVPLATSSDRAGLLDPAVAKLGLNDMIGSLESSDRPLVIAARISGPARTAFSVPPAGETAAPVKETKNVNIIVMADSDIFDDKFWVRTTNMMGRPMAAAFADNGAFVINAIENLMGSDDLISLRTRSVGERPFTLVRALEADAQMLYRRKTEALEMRLHETENRLNALQQGEGGPKAKGIGNLMQSPEQRKEIERFKHELIQTRAALRDVQRDLRKDIDLLGGFLAFVDIALMPLMVAGIAIAVAAWRRRKRTRKAVRK